MTEHAAFIDRDNTLITNSGDLGDPDLVRLVTGAAAALVRLADAGFALVVVTNQGGVARGAFTEEDVEEVHERICELIAEETGRDQLLEHFYYCPWHPEGTVERYRREHPWRKPQPGMLYAAAADLDLDLTRSWLVGDQQRDVEAGRAAGCSTVLLSQDDAVIAAAGPTAAAPDLAAAAEIILQRHAEAHAYNRGPVIPEDATRIAIVCPSWVGDTIMATPVYRAVRAARPDAKLWLVCRPGIDELLTGAPWPDGLIVGDARHTAGLFGIARAVRERGTEALLLLPNSFRSALLARLTKAPVRIGYRRGGRRVLLTEAVTPPRQRPIPAVEYYARLAQAALGLVQPGAIDRRIELFVTSQEQAEADRLLDGVPRPFALLCPGANRADKRWPAERFAAVADALQARHGLAVVATGAPGEAGVVADVARLARNQVTNLVDRGVTLSSLKGVAGQADVMITNDTGPRHIAAALGTPVVSLFGPTDVRWTTLEAAREHCLVAEPFLPEPVTADDHPRECAITRIAVGDVLAATERLLGAATGSGDAAPRAAPAPTPPA